MQRRFGITPKDPVQSAQVEVIESTLRELKVPAQVCDVIHGPTVTRYLVRPQGNIRVRRIELVADDLAMNLAAESVRIVTRIPGQPFVGIEVPNQEPEPVLLNDIHSSDEWIDSQAVLKLPLGKDIAGETIIADLTTMPHLLVAGATGSGKSVCLTSFITSLASQNSPAELRMVLIDPKMVELTMFNELPHLLYDVAVKPDQAAETLKLVVKEMEERYELLSKARKRNIASYNEESENPLPRIVVVIDELADLMIVGKREIEELLVRLAQLARAVGIHVIAATQRPSSDIITGLIKANFPTRIAFMVSTKVDSRVILDQAGAEALVGRGDMLYMSPQQQSHERIQGTFTPDSTLENVLQRWEKLSEFKSQRQEVTVEEPKARSFHETTWEEEVDKIRESWKEEDAAREKALEEEIASRNATVEESSDVETEEPSEVETPKRTPQKRSRAVRFINGLMAWVCGIALGIVILYILGEILL